MGKEHPASQQRSHETPDPLYRLSQVEADLTISRRTTDGEERIGGRLQRAQSRSHHKHATAESTKRSLDPTGPEEKASDSQDSQACHEGHSVFWGDDSWSVEVL